MIAARASQRDPSSRHSAASLRAATDLPLKQESVRFAVIGDKGTGEKAQYEVGQQMELFREKTGFDFVIMLGDNIYGGEGPADMKRKFEDPYKPLLDAGVKFYASLGNHDNPNERFYKPFNMGEKRYYSFNKGNAEFFALDSNYMDPQQTRLADQGASAIRTPRGRSVSFIILCIPTANSTGPTPICGRASNPSFRRTASRSCYRGTNIFMKESSRTTESIISCWAIRASCARTA